MRVTKLQVFTFIFIVAALFLTGCGMLAKVSLAEATMTTAVDEYNRPLDMVNTFQTDTREIHCSVGYSNAPKDTEVGAVWMYIQGELAEENSIIDRSSVKVEGEGYIDFRLTLSEEAWPRGDYAVGLYLNGEFHSSLPFYIR